MSTTTVITHEPPVPPTRRRWPSVLAALVVLGLVVTAIASAGVRAVDEQAENALRARMTVAFPDISERQWGCGVAEPTGVRTALSCSESGDAVGEPWVTFLALHAPSSGDADVDLSTRIHREMTAQDHSGDPGYLELLSVTDWQPTPGGPTQGTVSMWRTGHREQRHGATRWVAHFRYADQPFGVDVHAFSPAGLSRLVDALTFPAADALTDRRSS